MLATLGNSIYFYEARPVHLTSSGCRACSECSNPQAVNLVTIGMTRNRGQSPRGGVAECLLFSVADGRFDPKSNGLKGSAPSWKPPLRLLRHHPPEVALRLPPANGSDPSGIPVRTAPRTGWQETRGQSPRGGGFLFPRPKGAK